MNKTSHRARAIAIAETSDSARLVVFRLGMLATGATAALLALLLARAI